MNGCIVPQKPFVEMLTVEMAESLGARWADLGKRAADPNPFAEPAFVIPALRHIAPRCLVLLCVWALRDRERLDGLAILRPPLAPFFVIDVWRCDQAALPALLIDRATTSETIFAIAEYLAAHWPTAPGLGIPWIYARGSIAEAFRVIANERGVCAVELNPRQRAALMRDADLDFETSIDQKKVKEWRRLRRRLDERGSVEFAWQNTDQAIEDFLQLEAGGWKGSGGTALTAERGHAAFARSLLARFAQDGRLGVARLTLDQRLIASGVTLQTGHHSFFWKIAYDETLSKFSPGVQLVLQMYSNAAVLPNLRIIDSCADPDHPMIDRIWKQSLDLEDIIFPLRSASLPLVIALGVRWAKAHARALAKYWLPTAGNSHPWVRRRFPLTATKHRVN